MANKPENGDPLEAAQAAVEELAKVSKLLNSTAPTLARKGHYHSWTSVFERAAIIRLHCAGYRIGEIAALLKRSPATVRRCIDRHAALAEQRFNAGKSFDSERGYLESNRFKVE